jgi:nitrite reductase/ring-hydroxylating ferredoxin subunit
MEVGEFVMRVVVKAAEVEEGEPKQVCVPGRGPIAIYLAEGAYFATDDTCSHGDASLSDGLLEGFVIECPFHAGTFDIRDGRAIGYPATEDMKTYAVRREGDDLIVELT